MLCYMKQSQNKCIDRNDYATKRQLLCDMQQSQTHQSSNEMQRSLKDDYFANASIVQQKETIMPLKDDCLASAHRSHQPTR